MLVEKGWRVGANWDTDKKAAKVQNKLKFEVLILFSSSSFFLLYCSSIAAFSGWSQRTLSSTIFFVRRFFPFSLFSRCQNFSFFLSRFLVSLSFTSGPSLIISTTNLPSKFSSFSKLLLFFLSLYYFVIIIILMFLKLSLRSFRSCWLPHWIK